MCVRLPSCPTTPCPPASRPWVWFPLLSLPGPCPPPPPLGPFSPFSLSFQKRGQLCSPLGDAPSRSNSECRKETGPPSEACQASQTLRYSGSSPRTEWAGGFGAHLPPASALPFRLPPLAGQNWCSPLPLSPSADRGPFPTPFPF
jgi:hypothetical protein